MMSGLSWQVIGLVLLLGGVALGEWVLRRRGGVARQVTAERIVLLTMAGGFLGAPFWWRGDPDAFAWILPPLAGRMLAAASWAFAMAGLLALRCPNSAHFRLIGAMLAVYLGPLTVAILMLHLDRFDPARAVTWSFFCAVVLLLAGSVRLIMPGREAPFATAPSASMRRVLAALGGAAGLWGSVLFVWPEGPVAALWLWPADALTSRLIASMFLTVAVASWMARDSARLARTVMAVVLVYGIGVCLAGIANLASDRPLPIVYLAFWIAAAIAAAVSLAASPRPPAD